MPWSHSGCRATGPDPSITDPSTPRPVARRAATSVSPRTQVVNTRVNSGAKNQ